MPIDRPIPAFYCCYLLRPTVRHNSVYIGSTPNPVRRLGQHNGLTKGGAVRTNRERLRPWEMACIVTGFPSHIAALQFEWAWQNPHITLHIPPEERLQHATQKKRSGHPKRPSHSIQSLLSNLHLLLRVPSFARWPLDVRFFAQDVHKVWVKLSKTVDPLCSSLEIIQDFPPGDKVTATSQGCPSSRKRKRDHGIDAIEIDYLRHKPHVEKAKEIVDFEREGACAVCSQDLEHRAGIYTVCSNPGCEVVSHLTCLSKHFLKSETSESTPLVPIRGSCPACKTELRWVDVVKELTLRMRGQKVVEKLLKTKRVRKSKAVTASQAVIESSDVEDMSEEEGLSDVEGQLKLPIGNWEGNELEFGDSWHVIDDSDDSDAESAASSASTFSKARPTKPSTQASQPKKILPTVVEDSDLNDFEDIE